MKRIVVFLIFLLGVITSVANGVAGPEVKSEGWREDVPRGKRLHEPVLTPIEGFQEAYCVNISETSRVCRCAESKESSVSYEAQMIFEKDGKILCRWDASFMIPASLDAFRVDATDLDGDGKDELVVAALGGVSNGMAVEYWEVRVIAGDRVSKEIVVEDYEFMGYLTRNPASKNCMLLETRWFAGSEPGRGGGLYLMGRWFAYDANTCEFCLNVERPVIRRRYLYNFEKIRDQAMQSRKPVLWFSDKSTARDQ